MLVFPTVRVVDSSGNAFHWTELLLAPASALPMYIIETSSDVWECRCENRSDTEGFFPCTEEGEIVPWELGSRWDGKTYVCVRCWRLINGDTLEVLGVCSDETFFKNLDCNWSSI